MAPAVSSLKNEIILIVFLRFFHPQFFLALSRIGPVDKSKNSAETRSGSGRIVNLEIEKDGIYHPLKV